MDEAMIRVCDVPTRSAKRERSVITASAGEVVAQQQLSSPCIAGGNEAGEALSKRHCCFLLGFGSDFKRTLRQSTGRTKELNRRVINQLHGHIEGQA